MSSEMVFKVMSSDIIAVSEDATMRQAADIMRTRRIRHLPVTNKNGVIVGILSDRDIRRVQKVMKVNDFEETTGSGENHPVNHYMHYPVLEAKASDSIEDVAKRMLHSKISCFLIIDEHSAPCGIVTTDDLLKYLVDTITERDLDMKAPVGLIFHHLKVPTYE